MSRPGVNADQQAVAALDGVTQRYGKRMALQDVTLTIPAGRIVGLIGPDGVGKSTLLSLIAGSRAAQAGKVTVLGGDMADRRQRDAACLRIAYMPQGLGRNLYPTLSVDENLQFFGRLFGHRRAERRRRIDHLTRSTGLYPFLDRPAGKLSGGMRQKLGLCCALIHDPDLLILDEPTTGVDPLARSRFWTLIDSMRRESPGMSVLVATAYMDEARRFDWLVAMDAGRILATGSPQALLDRTGTDSLESAFIAMLPEPVRRGHHAVVLPPYRASGDAHEEIAIEAKALTKRFGDFVAVDHVSFRIRRGEIFGFLGSNGCGKSTTMKMLTGLLPASEGEAALLGRATDSGDLDMRRRVGYMSQSFSLYAELTVRQNLVLHARLFRLPEAGIKDRVDEVLQRFGLADVPDALPESLPPGIRQRLSLAVAMVHRPELLILDEPTSGVDPVARDLLWHLMIELARQDRVTIFVSTHFMNEAQRCDRVSLMHAGRVLVSGPPGDLVRQRGAATLEAAFIGWLEEAGARTDEGAAQEATTQEVEAQEVEAQEVEAQRVPASGPPVQRPTGQQAAAQRARPRRFSPGRAWSYTLRELLELRRDPMRAALALIGSMLLMFIMGYGINMDVRDLRYAVLDRDQSTLSQGYALNLSGSRYFVERTPIADYDELDRRMRSGELALAIEVPQGFGRAVERGAPVQIGVWIDGAMPARAETVQGYVQGMHQGWLASRALQQPGRENPAPLATVETRFRYNPDVLSLPAMVPAVIPLLLLMIPAMLTALSVVREKELGSIVNLYVTPVTRSEFLLGKQLPYVALGMLNLLTMSLLAVTVFGVPVKGSFAALSSAALLFVIFATGFGLFASTFTRSQVSAMFVAMIGTLIPATQFAGMNDPVSSLEGMGAMIGNIYPATYFLIVSRGVFNKALGFADLHASFWPLLAAGPVILAVSIALLRKQDR